MALHDVIVRVGADIGDYTSKMARARGEVRIFSNTTKQQGKTVQNSAKTTNKSMKLSAGSALRAASIITSAGAAIGGAFVAPVTSAAKFEHAFKGVEKTMSATPAQFKRVETGIRDMAKEMPQSAVEIAGVAEEAGRLGIKQDSVLGFTKTMVQMGDTTDMSSSQAAQSMSRLMNIMGTSKSEVKNLGSAISFMGNNAAASESEILELSRRLAGSAKQIGLTEGDLVGLAATMADLGIKAEMGGTAMQKTFLKLNTAVINGGDDLEKFAQVAGMSGEEFRKKFQDDAMGAVEAFVGGLSQMGESGEDVTDTLKQLGLGNERTLDTLLRLSSGHEKLSKNVEMSNEEYKKGTALQIEAEKMYDTLNNRLKIFLNKIVEIGIKIGSQFIPTLKVMISIAEKVVDAVDTMVEKFNDLPKPIKTTASALVSTVTVLGVFATGIKVAGFSLGKLLPVIGKLIPSLASLRVAFVTLNAFLGPAGWLAVGIGAVVTAMTVFNKATDDSGKATDEHKQKTKELSETTKELGESLEESKNDYKDTRSEINKNAMASSELADQVIDLANKESLSTAEKGKLNGLIKELNGSMAGLNLEYDEEAGKLNKSNKEIQNRVKLMAMQAEETAAQERLVEITKERQEVEMKLKDVNKEIKHWNDQMGESPTKAEKAAKEVTKLHGTEEKLKEELKKLGEQSRLTEEVYTEAVNGRVEAEKEASKQLEVTYANLSENQQQLVDSIVDDYDSIAEATTNMFEKIDTESKASFDQMKKTLEHNTQQTKKWAENLDKMAEWGVSEGLIQRLRDAGPESAAEVAEIVRQGKEKAVGLGETFDEGLDVAEDSLLAGLDLSEESAEVIKLVVKTMMTTFMEEMQGANFGEHAKTQFGDDVTENILNSRSKASRSVEDFVTNGIGNPFELTMNSYDFSKSTSKAADGAKQGLDGKRESVRGSAESLAKNGVFTPISKMLRQEEFTKIGKGVGEGVIKGIGSKDADVKNKTRKSMGLIETEALDKLEINSPSRVFMRIGKFVMEGFDKGFDSKKGSSLSNVSGFFSDLLGTSKKGMDDVDGGMKSGVSKVDGSFGKMPGLLTATSNLMKAALSRGKSQQVGVMRRLAAALPRPFSGLRGTMSSIGSNVMSGLLGGLNSMTGTLYSRASSIAGTIASKISGALKVKSPSRVTMAIGRNVGEGLDIGMANMESSIARTSVKLAKAATPYVDISKMKRKNISGFDSFDIESATSNALGSIKRSRAYNVNIDDNKRSSGGFNQTVNIHSNRPLSPSEMARKQKQASQRWALEMGF